MNGVDFSKMVEDDAKRPVVSIPEPIIDPFKALDAEGAHRLYLQIPKYAPFENTGAKEPARGFTYDEARRYIDDALPIKGLLSQEDELPVRGWACADTAVHAMYVVAANRMRPDRNEYVDEADWNRIKKVYNLINESDRLTCPPTVFGDNPLADIARLRQELDSIGEDMAIQHGENFDVLCEDERSAITFEQTRFFEPVVSDIGKGFDPTLSEYHAKTFEHHLMSEWVAGQWDVLGKVGAKDEYDRFGSLDESEAMNPYNGHYDASISSSFYMAVMNDPIDDEEWTEQQARDAQALLEKKVFSIIIENMDKGWTPSDDFKEVVSMDAVAEYARRNGIAAYVDWDKLYEERLVRDAEMAAVQDKSAERKAAEARINDYGASFDADGKEMSL